MLTIPERRRLITLEAISMLKEIASDDVFIMSREDIRTYVVGTLRYITIVSTEGRKPEAEEIAAWLQSKSGQVIDAEDITPLIPEEV